MLLVIPMLSNIPTSKDERNRILEMVESGQVTAIEAAQLLDAMEQERQVERTSSKKDRVLRLRATSVNAKNQKVYLTAVFPIALLRTSLRLGIRLIPQLGGSALEDLLQSIENETTGRILDLQDMEKGERLEIFVV